MYNIPCFYLVIIHSYGTLRTVYEIDATMHILGHSISFAGWPICQWVRKVSLGWLFHSTMLTISSLLGAVFCTTFYTIFRRICITPFYKLIFAPYTKCFYVRNWYTLQRQTKNVIERSLSNSATSFSKYSPKWPLSTKFLWVKSSHCDDYQHFGKWIQ